MNKENLVFKDFYEQMMEQKKAYEISSATMERIEVIWRKSISPFWKNIHAEAIDQQLIVAFINWHKKNRSGIQLVNVFKYLGNIMQVMVESGALPIEKKPKLELPKDEIKHHQKQKGRYITDDEFNSILRNSPGWFNLWLLIAYTSGMRKMEISKLELTRIKKINDRYIITLDTDNTKTGRARNVPLAKRLTEQVDFFIVCDKKYLFPTGIDSGKHVRPQSVDYFWKKAKQNAGIVGKMRLHDLRHSAASNMAKSGIDVVKATTLLGMSLQMFQRTYLKLTVEDLFDATDSAISRLEKK